MKVSCVRCWVLIGVLGLGGTSVRAEETKIETRLYLLPSCPVTQTPIPKPKPGSPEAKSALGIVLLSALISPAIEALVDSGVKMLNEAAADKTFIVPPPDPVEDDFYSIGTGGLLSLNKDFQCVVVIRGKFPSDDVKPGELASVQKLRDLKRAQKAFDKPLSPERLAELPLLYFEAVPIMSPDRKKFGLRPQIFYVGDFISEDGLFGPDRRSFNIAITLTNTFSNEPFASAEFKYDGVLRGGGNLVCLDKSSHESCHEIGLGGVRGWYATRPASEELDAKVKELTAKAATLAVAVAGPPTSPYGTENIKTKKHDVDKDDLEGVRQAYCQRLARANKEAAPALRQHWDDDCPAPLYEAKRKLSAALEYEEKNKAFLAADKVWKKECPIWPRDATGAAQCLQELDKPKNGVQSEASEQHLAKAGRFTLASAITETRQGNAVAKFFAPIAKDVSPKIKQALKEELDPLERQKVKDAETKKTAADAVNARNLARSARLAKLEVDKATAAYNQEANKESPIEVNLLALQIELLNKKTAANDAYLAAALPIPYPEVE